MYTAALLYNRNSAPHSPLRFEIAQHQYGIAEKTHIKRRLYWTYHSMLRKNKDRNDPKLVKSAKQLVQLEDEESFLWHSVHVAVNAVDHDDSYADVFHAFA